jgi:hypothetical protein
VSGESKRVKSKALLVSGESKRVKSKALLVSGEWNRFLTSRSDFLIYLAAGDFGVLVDLDGGKG